MNGLIGNNNIYKKNKKINFLWVKAIEEIQYYWNEFSDNPKLKIKELLYMNYNFKKGNIDRQIKLNIKKIISYIKDYENNIKIL